MRERLVSQRTGIINQIRAFLLERGIAVWLGLRFLRAELPRILATPPDVQMPGTNCGAAVYQEKVGSKYADFRILNVESVEMK